MLLWRRTVHIVSILLDRVVQTIVIIVRRRGREEHWGACTVLMHVGRAGSDSSRGVSTPPREYLLGKMVIVNFNNQEHPS